MNYNNIFFARVSHSLCTLAILRSEQAFEVNQSMEKTPNLIGYVGTNYEKNSVGELKIE